MIQNFYHGLVPQDKSHLDAAAGGAFFSLGVADAKALIEKIVSNQGWNDERLQPYKRGMHSLKEADMIVAKIDVLAKKMEQYERMSTQEAVQSLDSHMTCEVCGESGHSSNHSPVTHEDHNFFNNDNGFHHSNQGWNHHSNSQGNTFNLFPRSNFPNDNDNGYPSLKDLVYSQGRLTDNLNKKLLANDKILENINAKLDDFSSAMKNQLSFNKMLELKLLLLYHLLNLVEFLVNQKIWRLLIFVISDFKDKTRYAPYASFKRQISHIATNKG